jgi:phosphatidylglycerophosphate synthase
MLRHLPNLISAARLLACPALIALAASQRENAFRWLLIAALLSDIVDGLLARSLGLQSRLGAMLDSAADMATLVAAVAGIAAFHPDVLRDHAPGCIAVVGGWLLVSALALIRYRRLSSFHTYASKAAGYGLGLFLVVLFLWGFRAPLFDVAVAASVAASIEELALLWFLPVWESDVRGLWWILRDRRG